MPLDAPAVPDDDPTRQEMLNVLIASGLYAAADFNADDDLLDPGVRFDKESAMYWFAHDWHLGQTSNHYLVLSNSQYKPGASMRWIADESQAVANCYDHFKRFFIHN